MGERAIPVLLLVGALGCGETGEQGRMVGMTAEHNAVRDEADNPAPEPALPDLRWDDDIADVAQDYADELADRDCDFRHSGNPKYGENLAWFSNQRPEAADVARAWASERDCYGHGRFKATDSCSSACDDSGGCGHYTQMIWRDTRRLGCGHASCGNREVWVCNYAPPGNFLGEAPY